MRAGKVSPRHLIDLLPAKAIVHLVRDAWVPGSELLALDSKDIGLGGKGSTPVVNFPSRFFQGGHSRGLKPLSFSLTLSNS